MTRSAFMAACLLPLCAATAYPQGVAIDHKAVGCIVVGKYPKMNACFTPAANVARSRVYFRPEGTPNWYYVEMKSDQPCFTGILPRPGKKLVGKKIEYYVEAQDKSFAPARTAEYGPVVVRSAQECKKEAPPAFLNNATVAVFPALPAGFLGGGIGTGAVIGIAAAGAAAAGTAAVVASNNNDATTTTVVSAVVTTTTLAPATTTTTTVPKAGNRPPFAVLTTNPDPPAGNTPLTVTFDMCKSSDPDGDPLSFFFNFGDGSQSAGSCSVTHTYTATTFVDVRATANFEFTGSVVDPSGASATRSRTVVVQPPPPPTTTTTTTTLPPCPPPTISILTPKAGQCFTTTAVPVSATATGAQAVVFISDEIDCSTLNTNRRDEAQTPQIVGSGPTYSTIFTVGGPVGTIECYRIKARAFSACSTALTDAVPVEPITVDTTFRACTIPAPLTGGTPAATAWSSDLAVDNGEIQMTVNGADLVYARHGRSDGSSILARGQNRVEATLVAGDGKPGLWRFAMVNGESIEPGSIHVIAGETLALSASSVTFRLKGTPGERIVFTFRKR